MGGGGWLKKAKGSKSKNRQLQNGRGDAKSWHIHHELTDVVPAVSGARWALALPGHHFINYIVV